MIPRQKQHPIPSVFREQAASCGPWRLLALLGMLLLTLQPAAAGAHHHGEDHADEASCPVCIWQAHHAADLPPGGEAGAPGDLGPAPRPADESAAVVTLATGSARAPPGADC